MIETDRLLLRNWKLEDHDPFFQMNSDPRVMEFMPKLLTRKESDSFVEKTTSLINKNGYGLWAVEIKKSNCFIGFVGLSIPTFEAHFTPCVEVGWRLDCEYWGNGYATEGGKFAIKYGFENLELDEIVSFTVPKNKRSRNVMERLGLSSNPEDDFNHPRLSNDDPLSRHVLYKISKSEWEIQKEKRKKSDFIST